MHHWHVLKPTLLNRISHHQLQDAADDDYDVETPEIGVFILSDGVGKPFSVHLAADDGL